MSATFLTVRYGCFEARYILKWFPLVLTRCVGEFSSTIQFQMCNFVSLSNPKSMRVNGLRPESCFRNQLEIYEREPTSFLHDSELYSFFPDRYICCSACLFRKSETIRSEAHLFLGTIRYWIQNWFVALFLMLTLVASPLSIFLCSCYADLCYLPINTMIIQTSSRLR